MAVIEGIMALFIKEVLIPEKVVEVVRFVFVCFFRFCTFRKSIKLSVSNDFYNGICFYKIYKLIVIVVYRTDTE